MGQWGAVCGNTGGAATAVCSKDDAAQAVTPTVAQVAVHSPAGVWTRRRWPCAATPCARGFRAA